MPLTPEQIKALQDKASQRGVTTSNTSTNTPETSIFDKYGLPKPTRATTLEPTTTPSLKDRLSSLGTGALNISKTIVGETGKAASDIGGSAVAAAITPIQYGINQIGGRLTDRQDVVDMPIGEVYDKARETIKKEMTSPVGEEYTPSVPDLTTIKGAKEVGGESVQTAATVFPIGKAASFIKNIGEAAAVGGLYNLGKSVSKDESLGDNVLSAGEGALTLGAGVGVLKGIGKGIERLMTPAETLVKNKIIELYNKSIKPTITGKGTTKQVEQYQDKVLSGIKSIVDNKANLQFTDEYGDIIKGESPKSLSQAAEAIDQTKKNIFTKYDTMAKQAGESGATVETQPVIDELSTIINNKSVALANPKAITYAKELQNRLSKVNEKGEIIGYETLTPSETQDVIQHLNKSLESFYKNPTYDSATQASIDALFANKLREGLDGAVSKLSGEYQGFKNEYGALSSIEKDVVKASLRDARKNIKGLVDFTDILSGGELINGLISMNPATMAKAGVMKGISEYIKYLNNPNRIISKVFQNAEKLPAKAAKAVEEVSQNVPNQSPKTSLLSTKPNATNPTMESINNISETIPQIPKNTSIKKMSGFVQLLKETPEGKLKGKILPEDADAVVDFADVVNGESKVADKTHLAMRKEIKNIAKQYNIKGKTDRELVDALLKKISNDYEKFPGFAELGLLPKLAIGTALGVGALKAGVEYKKSTKNK